MVTSPRRILLFAAVLGFLITLLYNIELIQYGLLQARGQLKILANAVPVEQLLQDPEFDIEKKEKIEAIQEAREFAVEIGLVESENYTTYYDQKGKPILWNVSACEPFSFESKEWSFPIIGSFGYKGFFSLEKAFEEEALLSKEGYDTRIRTVGAWSTLGWFKDPILSNMLERDVGNLVETIFHELTHGTIFIKDSLVFNENLATYVGEKTTELFLVEQYGRNSDELRIYLNSNKDSQAFREHILQGKEKLDSLYNQIEGMGFEEKVEKKTVLIKEIVQSLDTITFSDSAYYNIFKSRLPNNAYFMSFSRYHSNKAEMDSLFAKCGNDMATFIDYFR